MDMNFGVEGRHLCPFFSYKKSPFIILGLFYAPVHFVVKSVMTMYFVGFIQ